MKQILMLIPMLFIGVSAFTQKQNPQKARLDFCGNDLVADRDREAFQKRVRDRQRDLPPPEQNKGDFKFTVPVVIYEVNCNANSLPLFTPQQAEGQIATLNSAFNEFGIRFCLATKKGNTPLPGNPLPGVIRVNNYPLCIPDIPEDWESVVALSDLPYDRYLRIFVVRGFADFTVLGVGAFPYMPPERQGIIIASDAFGNVVNCGGCNLPPDNDMGKVLIHEVGHYLGLYHTFRDGCGNPGDDCNVQGDGICDTPPDNNDYVGNDNCPADPSLYTCYPGAEPPLVDNHMAYTSQDCRTSFTNGQQSFMQGVLTTERDLLVSEANLLLTGVDCSPTTYCDIYASKSIICLDESIQFDNFFYDDATYIWDFGDGDSDSGIPVNHTYAGPGPYTVRLRIKRDGIITECEQEVYVHKCLPISSAQGLWYFGFLAGLDFSSGLPVADLSAYSNNSIFTDGGSVVQARADNELLFYSDGQYLWDENHQQITGNLAGLYGSLQAGVCVPVPGSPGQYYLFIPNGQLTYSIITDLAGTVDITMMNTIVNPTIADYAFNPITAIPVCDGSGYWVLVARNLFPDEVHVYKVDINGVSLATVFHSAAQGINCIKASPDGTRVALGGSPFTVCSFDGFTGTLGNEQQLADWAYTASFSPNSQLVYGVQPWWSDLSRVYQYQVNAANPGATGLLVAEAGETLGSVQSGPDGRLYLARRNNHRLAVINYPDAIISSGNNECGFTLDGPQLNIPVSRMGLPNFIDAGASKCGGDECDTKIAVKKECLKNGESWYSQVTLYYQGKPIQNFNDPNCCVTWEYIKGIPAIPCPRPGALPDQNFNPMDLPQGQHYQVTIVCGDCTYTDEGIINCPDGFGNQGGKPDGEKAKSLTMGDIRSNSPVIVYPNPAKSEIAVRFQEELSSGYVMEIYDAYGRQVLSHPMMAGTQWQLLDVSTFTPGIYAWSLKGVDGKTIVEKGKIVVMP